MTLKVWSLFTVEYGLCVCDNYLFSYREEEILCTLLQEFPVTLTRINPSIF